MAPCPPGYASCGFYKRICNVNTLCKHLTYLYNIWTIFFYIKTCFFRSFIYSETNTFGLPKFSKISFAFNIFVPIPVQAMV